MVCTVIVEFQITPETADEFRQAIHEALKETRNRDGNLMARFFFVQDPDGYKIEVLEKHGRYV